MDKDLDVAALERHGLTVRQVLGLAPETISLPPISERVLTIFMQNDVRRSTADNPSVPIAADCVELMRIDVKANIITLTSIAGDSFVNAADGSARCDRRRYGLKSVPLLGACVFMLLSELPEGIEDTAFIPARGTAVLFDDLNNGPRALRASGVDEGTGNAGGWIYEAIEI